MPVTRVEPTNKLFDPARTFRYTNAANTDIAKRFKAMQAKAKADAKARELAAVDSRQQCLDIEAPTVLQLPHRGRRGAV